MTDAQGRAAAVAAAEDALDSGRFEEDLARLVAIPSESQVAEGLPHCARYLSEAMEPRLSAMG
ncbi:MAG: M20 peptidase family dipeptidase, partial [Pseudomonadota bacterium]